jgi:hypothetical protein
MMFIRIQFELQVLGVVPGAQYPMVELVPGGKYLGRCSKSIGLDTSRRTIMNMKTSLLILCQVLNHVVNHVVFHVFANVRCAKLRSGLMIDGSHQHVIVWEEDPKTFPKYSDCEFLGCVRLEDTRIDRR